MPSTERGVHALKKRYIIKTNLEATTTEKFICEHEIYSRFKYKVSRQGQFNRIETWQKDNINLYILIWQSFQEDWKYLLETVN